MNKEIMHSNYRMMMIIMANESEIKRGNDEEEGSLIDTQLHKTVYYWPLTHSRIPNKSHNIMRSWVMPQKLSGFPYPIHEALSSFCCCVDDDSKRPQEMCVKIKRNRRIFEFLRCCQVFLSTQNSTIKYPWKHP